MADMALEYGSPASIEYQERRARKTRASLRIVAFIVAIFLVAWLYVSVSTTSISRVSISNLHTIGKTDLCPGEPLVYSFNRDVTGSGLLLLDRAIKTVDPPQTLIYSESKRDPVEGAFGETIIRSWHVPTRYLDPVTDTYMPLPAGEYRMTTSISSFGERNVTAVGGVNFRIRGDCNE